MCRSEREDIAKQSVIDLHLLIEAVFTDRDGKAEESLPALLTLFAENFQMVTTTGVTVEITQVAEMFRQQLGKRPTLAITIDECEAIASGNDSVSLRYREAHHQDGAVSVRWSQAVIVFEERQPRWRYLQETFIR